MNVKTILVPLDGSFLGKLALTPAVDLAREKDARLVLLRAAEAHTTVTDPTDAQVAAVREAEDDLAVDGSISSDAMLRFGRLTTKAKEYAR